MATRRTFVLVITVDDDITDDAERDQDAGLISPNLWIENAVDVLDGTAEEVAGMALVDIQIAETTPTSTTD